ncbi:hypothetical protein AAE478_002977 [Parahypoxylon ruwenzoriense]
MSAVRETTHELVQEIQSIKQSVGGQSSPLPGQATAYPQQNVISPSKEPGPSRLGMPSPASVTTGPEMRAPSTVSPANVTITPSSVIHTPATIPLAQNPVVEPSLPRALGSQPFSGEDIDYYFQKDPNKCYESGPLLFWTIIYIASRRYAKTPTVFPFLLDAMKRDAFSAITSVPLSMSSINAFILLCAWVYPDVRFINDPSSLFSSVCMNAALQLGIHTGKGAHPEYSHGVFQNCFADEEASFTWAGYNIIAQRVSSSLGIPPLGGLFNQTVQNIIDGRTPFQVPSTFRVLLECQKFCNHLSKTMVACLEESRGVSAHIVQTLEDEWNAVRGLICSERADDLDRFNALLVQLEIQTYYFIPLPGYHQEPLKRNIVRAYNTARTVIRGSLELDDKTGFLRHLPHFYFRALLAAGCVVYRLLRSSYMNFLDRKEAEQSAADAVAACRRSTITEGDLPMRLGNLLESWSEMLARTGQWGSDDPVSTISCRLTASVTLDCITRWKSDHMNNRSKTPAAGAAAGGSDCGNNTAATSAAASETPGLLTGATTAAAAAADSSSLQNIDWSFMDDFDWNFEPVIPVLTVPT